jgi:O-antigen/teichoic acid export membrane protein
VVVTGATGVTMSAKRDEAVAVRGARDEAVAVRSTGDEAVAVRGARWNTASYALAGALNYAYALLLTRFLDAGAFSRFAAGQGLILCTSTAATVSVPWVLAQSLARARSDAERGDAVRFAIVIAIGGGLVAAAAVGVVAGQFGGAAMIAALAGSTIAIFASTVTVGWLTGRERLRTLSVLTVAEAALKTLVGLILVAALGLGDTGALAAFGIGILPCLFWWPAVPRGARRLWRGATANRDLWRRAVGLAGVQVLVVVMGAVDVVLVTILSGPPSAKASYQASAVLARVPLFLASAISISFFPSLSRRRSDAAFASRALRMYVVIALPLTVVLATAPAAVLSTVFPARYSMIAALLRFTAIAGFAVGAINLMTTFFQAANDYTCLTWQAAGLLFYLTGLLIGWSTGGTVGFAVGAACGAVIALVLVAHHLRRRLGAGVFRRLPIVEPVIWAGCLTLLRPYLILWLLAAVAAGLRATERFLARSASVPRATAAALPAKGEA